MNLHTLLECLHPSMTFPFLQDIKNMEIKSIENNHRKVIPGSLFVCIKGYTVDGHQFAQLAEENGAAAIIAEKPMTLSVPVIVVKNTKKAMSILADAFYGQPSRRLHMIGVTGTNGKTTTSHLIEQIFADYGQQTGLIGTLYTKIGEALLETSNTTPESLVLQKTFSQMLEQNVKTAVMEVSSHALVEGRVQGVDFNIAVFTNLTQDHLDYHKTMEAYKHAKGLLFSQLGNTFRYDEPKYAILNVDDPASKDYLKETAVHILTYAIDHHADFQATSIKMTPSGTTFTLISPFGTHRIHMSLVGKFSVYNVLASIAAAAASGIPIEKIAASVEKVKGVAGRFEMVHAGQHFSVIVDYSHTPDSLENALKTIRQFAKKKIYVVVGCGGDRDRTKRPLMAKIACQYATDAIFTSDNPRSEDPVAIIHQMEEGVKGKRYKSFIHRKEAIEDAIFAAEADDVVLIAGKGHETYQQIGKIKFDFDDRLVAKEAIEKRLGKVQ
ncbi:UDP-N-acetylmuramoyl-L-alanyl-D-glutamate--2,6-diaminopimelate ligase [Bacillaceae bacterium Marseille-Q3522]|nr:UDP-N-acetylmuramoyl-L-alanyl-D-glutamate--2,6-diaminopimelate ligase [Bacillaceae bacterium Marseille-Q3522]